MNAVQIKEITESAIMPMTQHVDRGSCRDGTTFQVPREIVWEIQGNHAGLPADVVANSSGVGHQTEPDNPIGAALCSSLAEECWTWAARLGVPLDSVRIDVETQHQACETGGHDHQVQSGCQRLSCSIQVSSRASDDEIIHLVELTQAYNGFLSDLRERMSISCDLTILRSDT